MAAVSTTIYLSTSSSNATCNESSISTIPSSYGNYTTRNGVPVPPGQFVLAMAPGCTAKLFVSGPNDQTNDSESILRTMVGTWFFIGQPGGGGPHGYGVNPLSSKDLVNVSLILPPSKNVTAEEWNYNYTIVITASASAKGFYVLRTPYFGYIPLAVGYSVSQVNLTEDYPGFGQPIPTAGGALRIHAISGASFGFVNDTELYG